jgi:hypothetical protein
MVHWYGLKLVCGEMTLNMESACLFKHLYLSTTLYGVICYNFKILSHAASRPWNITPWTCHMWLKHSSHVCNWQLTTFHTQYTDIFMVCLWLISHIFMERSAGPMLTRSVTLCSVWGCPSGISGHSRLLGYDTVCLGQCFRTVRRILLFSVPTVAL